MTESERLLLQALLDERDIIGRINAYCTALDGRRFDDLRQVYAADATARLGSTDCPDLDAIVAKCQSSLSRLDASHHLVGNNVIVIDADRATSRSYVQAQHVNSDVVGEPTFLMAGFYDDNWIRTSAGWRIQRRVLTITWTSGNPAVVGR